MDSIHVQGGIALQGKVRIQGSKNAALPILAATVLTQDASVIYNCPKIRDVHCMVNILRRLGFIVKWEKDALYIKTKEVTSNMMSGESVNGMRSSLCLLGALIGRNGKMQMEYPGGCMIGERPMDLHKKALQDMGVEFEEKEGYFCAKTRELHGADVLFPFPSVGATENVILAAVLAQGDTNIVGAAREPEVEALCRFLIQCGAKIEGMGTDCIHISGVKSLYGTEFKIPEDRIVAGTYLFGSLMTGGSVFLENAPIKEMDAVVQLARRMGAQCEVEREGIYVQAETRPIAVPKICTEPYPGFPTDLQSMALATMTIAKGESVIQEKIFENRFLIAEDLKAMGAKITVLDQKTVLVRGRENLIGTNMTACELRGGAALVLAGLAAEGESVVKNCFYINRGYENICRDLRELGARVTVV